MTTNQVVPAVQYLRMSTEHQQYSLENQSVAIQRYAESHGFEVVRTYTDEAKSGVVLKQRPGLRQLLRDVVSGTVNYSAILVYDVSRWGRFQDMDESAHYEFLCKSAGVPVHYCAEQFSNDGTMPSLIMKALKRTMAGEYSRELGVKVVAGQKRLTMLGFKQGGTAGYGLRRMLVSSAGIPKQELGFGERKSITTDRVVFVPGPAHEVQIVKEIFRMLISEKRSICNIARKLNTAGVLRPGSLKWDHYAIRAIVTNPKYTGCSVFGRTTSRLYSPLVKLPRSEWTIKPGAFESLVDEQTFEAAQKAYAERHFPQTGQEMLDDLRKLLSLKGRLSVLLIDNADSVPSSGTYRNRFGSVRNAYARIGYRCPGRFNPIDARLLTSKMRERLVARIAKLFPNLITILRPNRLWRGRLQMPNGLMLSVVVSRYLKPERRWLVCPIRDERTFTTLVARLDKRNKSFLDFHVFADMDRRNKFRLSLDGRWLRRGKRLHRLSNLLEVVERVRLEARNTLRYSHQ